MNMKMTSPHRLNKNHLMIEHANSLDIQQIHNLFKHVQITPDNIEEKLEPSHENSFANKGGFFKILSEDELRQILKSSQDTIHIARIDDKICSVLWCKKNLSNYKEMQLNMDHLEDSERSDIQQAFNNNSIFAVEEIAAIPFPGINTIYDLTREAYLHFLNLGFTHALLQIYTISGEIINDRVKPMSHVNKPSTHITLTLGGVPIGTNPVPAQTVGQRAFIITSKVYIYPILTVLDRLM